MDEKITQRVLNNLNRNAKSLLLSVPDLKFEDFRATQDVPKTKTTRLPENAKIDQDRKPFSQFHYGQAKEDEIDWQEAVARWQADMDDWREDQGCPACLFLSKTGWYGVVRNFAPPGLARERLISASTQLFSTDPLQENNPALWLGRLSSLLGESAQLTKENREVLDRYQKAGVPFSMQFRGDGAFLRSSLRATRNPILIVYARLEEIAPTKLNLPEPPPPPPDK